MIHRCIPSAHALAVLAVYLLCTACEAAPNRESPDNGTAVSKVAPPATEAAAEGGAQQEGAQVQPAEIQRQVIYTARLQMRVKNVDRSHDSVIALLGSYRAYIASDSRLNYGDRIENTITIRVERSQFWNLLTAVSRQATYIDEKKVESEDVTGAIADIQERIKSKLAAEEQYREILKRAVKVQDILEVQQYLSTIREEIELMQARLSRLNDQSAYSTITIAMYEKDAAMPLPPEETFWGRAGEAVAKGWNMLTSFALAMLTVWPLWLIAGLLVYSISRFSKVKKNRPPAPNVEHGESDPTTKQ